MLNMYEVFSVCHSIGQSVTSMLLYFGLYLKSTALNRKLNAAYFSWLIK